MIVTTLKAETSAQIALCSLGPIGEDPNSADPIQRELNNRVEQFSRIIKETARVETVDYIPFYERLHEQIVASPGRPLTASISYRCTETPSGTSSSTGRVMR